MRVYKSENKGFFPRLQNKAWIPIYTDKIIEPVESAEPIESTEQPQPKRRKRPSGGDPDAGAERADNA